MQFYGIFFIYPYKHSVRWQDVFDIYRYMNVYIYIYIKVNGKEYQAHPAIDQTAYMDARKK